MPLLLSPGKGQKAGPPRALGGRQCGHQAFRPPAGGRARSVCAESSWLLRTGLNPDPSAPSPAPAPSLVGRVAAMSVGLPTPRKCRELGGDPRGRSKMAVEILTHAHDAPSCSLAETTRPSQPLQEPWREHSRSRNNSLERPRV